MRLKPWQIMALYDTEGATPAGGGGNDASAAAAAAAAKAVTAPPAAPAAAPAAPTGEAPPAAPAASAAPATPDPNAAPNGDPASSGMRTDDNAVPDNLDAMVRSHTISQFPEGDERSKAEKYLERRSSVVDIVRSGMNADARIQELTDAANQRIKPPTAESTPEEIESFRQAMNIPQSYTDYQGFRPEGRQFTEAETQMEQRYFQFAHENNMTPTQVMNNMAFLDAYQNSQAEARAAQVKEASDRSEDTLRVKYGTDFRDKKSLGEEFLKQGLAPHVGGNAELGDLLNKRFEDGTALGENPAFFGWVIDMAIDAQDAGALDFNSAGGTNSGGGVDVEARIAELRAKAHSRDPAEKAEYASPAVQQEIKSLVARQMRQQQRNR
jgi:hypothetical protein